MQAVRFGKIDFKMEKAVIIANGPSLAQAEPHLTDALTVSAMRASGVNVVAVNSVVKYLPHVDYWFSLDPSRTNQEIMSIKPVNAEYVAAVPTDYGKEDARVPVHRVEPTGGVRYVRRLTGNGPFGSKFRLSEDPSYIHTGNSVWGALGMCFLAGAKKVGILGLDANQGKYHFGGGEPRSSLKHLPELFGSATAQLRLAGVEVRNGNANSAVDCFKKCSAISLIDWLIAG